MAYSAWEIPESERTRLLSILRPEFTDVVAHHVTYELGAFDALTAPPEVICKIVGYASDDSLECYVVEIDGSSKRTALPGTYHITWSLEKALGRKPVDSNDVIAKGWAYLPAEIEVKVVPRVLR